MALDARKFINFFTKGPVSRHLKIGLVIVGIIAVVIIAAKKVLNDPNVKPNNFKYHEVQTKVRNNPGKLVVDSYLNKNYKVHNPYYADKFQHVDKTKNSFPRPKNDTGRELKPSAAKQNVFANRANNTEKQESTDASPLDLYTAKVDTNSAPLEKFAPYGRPIPCQLVNTVDTANTQTPIIGRVIEDVWNDGKLIIPAGTEVHGTAKASPIRDKVLTGTSWVLVWRTQNTDNGKELKLHGIALEDGKLSGKKGKYAPTDMSAGLKGYTVDTRDWAQLKAIALKITDGLTALPAAAMGTVSNLAGGGGMVSEGQDSANLYADMMMSKVLREGYFVRVPAGTKFYLYVEQTINMDKAKIGEMLYSEYNQKSSTDNNPPVMSPTYNPQISRGFNQGKNIYN